MLNYLKIFLLGLAVCLMASCQNDASIDTPSAENASKTLELTSTLSNEDCMSTCFAIKSQMKSVSRATQLSEAEAKLVVEPLVKDGLQLKAQIVRQVENDPTLKSEAKFYKNLSDEDCAALSFVVHSMQTTDLELQGATIYTNGDYKLNIDKERIIHCLPVAVGYDFLKKPSTEADYLRGNSTPSNNCNRQTLFGIHWGRINYS